MGVLVALVGITVLVTAFGLFAAERMDVRRARRIGRGRPVISARRRWAMRSYAMAWAVAIAVSVWALNNGHGHLGIALLVAFFILPEFIIVPIQIRRSRQRAAEARARREAKNA